MKAIRTALIAAGVVVVGLAICPRPPRDVDPDEVLTAALEAERTIGYRAHRVYERTLLGRTERREEWARGPSIRTENDTRRDLLTWQNKAELIRLNYTPLVEGRDTIAGRKAWTLRLKPHAKQFPWKQLWVDSETGVVLAQREWSGRNHIKASMKTLSIDYDHTLDQRTEESASAPDSIPARPPLAPAYLPDGFKLCGVRAFGANGVNVAYSDGLFVLSVSAVKRSTAADAGWRITDSGQALVCSGIVDGTQITVVGDLPTAEMVKVAESVR